MKKEAIMARVQKMETVRAQIQHDEGVESLHVKVMQGNRKTGASCWTVSLFPIIDCGNCSACKGECYDTTHDMIYPNVIRSRAINSLIHKYEPSRYFREIGDAIKANAITELRFNVGGDFSADDFLKANDLAREFPGTDMMIFTKNYNDCNWAYEKCGKEFAPNLHVIFSRWKGTKCDNPYNFPESHVLYPNGETTAPEFGAYYCGGNCSVCHFHKVQGNKKDSGCWGLAHGECVVFKYH